MIQPSLTGRFGNYEILEELGSGGMGKVYRARNVTLERVVALKTLSTLLSSDQEFVKRFLKEARAAASLNHPGIVQIYDFGCEKDIYYLAMEYVDGKTLRAHLKAGPFSEYDSVLVMRHAVRALAVAHAQGIVHRDIKPDNIMLNAQGELKLVDLGIAKRLNEDQSLTQTGQAVGTPQYISPEQIRGQKDIDARADIYSLGATFYHLATGHTPFKGSSSAHVMSMHLTHPLPDPRQYANLSEGVCRVLRKMMAKDREERYPNVIALDRDLYRLQIGEPPQAAEPSETSIATMVSQPSVPPSSRFPQPTTPRTPPPEPIGSTRSTTAPPSGAVPPPIPAAATPPPVPTPSSAFREEDLHFVEVELAKHIGPLARVLVKKAAKSAQNLVGLAASLAENIPDEEGRRAFRNVVRQRAK